MGRYLRVLLCCWRAGVEAELEYRINFVLAALTSLGTVGGALFTLSLFYRHGFTLGDWSWPQVLLVVGFYTALEGVQAAFLAPNYQRLSEHVREGTLDFALLKPLDSQFQVSLRALSLWGLPDIALGAAIVGYAGSLHEPALPASAYLAGLAPFLLAVVVLYGMGFVLATLNIWFTKLWNLTHALQALLQAGRYPVHAYPFGLRIFFTFVLPVAFLTTVPAQAVAGKPAALSWVLGAAGLAVVLLVASRLFWRFALRYYTSASS